MAGYLAMRIEAGKLNYKVITTKFPQFKDEIDEILAFDGYTVKEDGSVVKVG